MKEVGVCDRHDLWLSLLPSIVFKVEANQNDRKPAVWLITRLNPHPNQCQTRLEDSG
jgi:hypothetical protein